LHLWGDEDDGRFEESFWKNFQAGNFQLIVTYPEVAVNNRHCRDIYVIYREGGLYGKKLCPRS